MTGSILAGAVTVIVFAFVAFLLYGLFQNGNNKDAEAQRAAGREGEDIIEREIRSVLNYDDFIIRNAEIICGSSRREFDFIIVNSNGVFIIETKNYRGYLTGKENDYNWGKYHVSGAGNVYYKEARNPILQSAGQAGFLGRYLRSYGVNVWVDGYAVILGSDSPVKSDRILYNRGDIDRAIHSPKQYRLNAETVSAIKRILSQV